MSVTCRQVGPIVLILRASITVLCETLNAAEVHEDDTAARLRRRTTLPHTATGCGTDGEAAAADAADATGAPGGGGAAAALGGGGGDWFPVSASEESSSSSSSTSSSMSPSSLSAAGAVGVGGGGGGDNAVALSSAASAFSASASAAAGSFMTASSTIGVVGKRFASFANWYYLVGKKGERTDLTEILIEWMSAT